MKQLELSESLPKLTFKGGSFSWHSIENHILEFVHSGMVLVNYLECCEASCLKPPKSLYGKTEQDEAYGWQRLSTLYMEIEIVILPDCFTRIVVVTR